MIAPESDIRNRIGLPEKGLCKSFSIDGIGHSQLFILGFNQPMGQKKRLRLITRNMVHPVKDHIHKGFFELSGLLGDIVKVIIFFIKK